MAKQLFTKDLKPVAPGQASSQSAQKKPVSGRQNRFSREMPVKNAGIRMNEQIRVAKIRVIDEEGVVGVMSPAEAMKIAAERGVDLIEIAPNADPPVCKLMDFGKYRYEQQKRERAAKATQHKQLLKELRFHPGTDTHDFDFKVRHARTWLEEGHKVKAYVQFKGREIAYKEFGENLLKRLQEKIGDISKIDQNIALAGKTMSMVFSPVARNQKKSDKSDKKDNAHQENEKQSKKDSEFAEQLKAKLGDPETVSAPTEEQTES